MLYEVITDCSSPESATIRRLPIPAETFSGTICASAFITVSASWLPGQKRAITGAGKVGLARQPLGATISMARVSPAFCGIAP